MISKKDIRDIICLITPIIMGFLGAIAESTRAKCPLKGSILWGVTVLILCGFVCYWFNSKKVFTNENRAYEEQDKQIQTYKQILSGFINDFQLFSTEVNTLIHEIELEGRINLNIWSFDKASGEVCGQVYNTLCTIADEKKFGVSYIRLIEDSNEDSIIMTGCANWNSTGPSILQTIRQFKGPHADVFHDSKLFLKKSSDIDILLNEEEIKREFELHDKNVDKYSQYIGVPVFCDGTKMVGLLEIVCIDGGKLSDTREGVLEIAHKFLEPYAYFFLFLHKLEKAILAQPNKKQKKKRFSRKTDWE